MYRGRLEMGMARVGPGVSMMENDDRKLLGFYGQAFTAWWKGGTGLYGRQRRLRLVPLESRLRMSRPVSAQNGHCLASERRVV